MVLWILGSQILPDGSVFGEMDHAIGNTEKAGIDHHASHRERYWAGRWDDKV